MNARMRRPRPAPRRQEGVALFIALVVLLIITVLGISGLQTTTLEERMAASARDRDIAFQAAEAALAQGEDFARNVGVTDLAIFDANAAGFYRPVSDAATDDWWQTVDWRNDNTLPQVAVNVAGVSTQPKFIIEYVERLLPGEDTLNINNVGGSVGSPSDIFRITAFATGGSDRASVMLQTTYGAVLSTNPGGP